MKVIFVFFVMMMGAMAHAQETSTAYADNLKLREARRVGLGTQIGGTAGMLGLLLELNLEDQDGTTVGAGFGDQYGTFTLSWKHSFEGTYFTPYTTLGWSRWYSLGRGVSDSHVVEGMLTRSERDEGRYGIDFIAASGGMQYNQLDGDFAGATLFGEVNLMFAPFRGKVLPTAAVGTSYFF